ncbi:MAG: YceI family protein [Anaerolineae bacterium]|nr:YceI family protein [Anaerolineae bacterium]
MPRFRPVRHRSEFRVDARSNVHPIQASSSELEGFFEAALLDNGQLDLSVAPSGRLEIYIDSLDSGNKLIDREAQRRFNTRRYPSIIAEVVAIEETTENGAYRATGDLTFHGETQRLEDDLVVRQVDDDTIEVSGEITIDVRDFGVQPPRMLMLKVYPDIKVTLKVVAKRVD